MLTAKEIEDGLRNFCGTESYHRASPIFRNIVMTDGVKWLCEHAECYWLMDVISSYQPQCMKDPMLRDIQFWRLKVNPDKSAVIICDRDAGEEAFRQEIPYTTFPLPEILLWVERGETMVILLPSEH